MKYVVLLICCLFILVVPFYYLYKQHQLGQNSDRLQVDIRYLIDEWVSGELGKRNYDQSFKKSLEEKQEYISSEFHLIASDSLMGIFEYSYCFESGSLLHLMVSGEYQIEGLIQGALYAPDSKAALSSCGT